MFAQTIRGHRIDALVALVQPIQQSGEIGLRVDAVHALVPIVDERDFVGTYHLAVFINPDAGGHVHHAVQRGDGVLFVDENGVIRIRFFNPRTGIFDAADIFRYRNDFEILILVFGVEFLPAWQIEAAASPGCPGDQQYALASEIVQRARRTLPIRKREIGRFQRVRDRA